MREFLRMRAVPGVEKVEGDAYLRTAREGDAVGFIRVAPLGRHSLALELSPGLAEKHESLVQRVRRLFDLDADPAQIAKILGKDRRLAALVARRPGLRVARGFDAAEIATRAILGQQVTVGAARTLAGRLARTLGDPLPTPHDGLERLWPTPRQLADALPVTLIGIPLTRARAEAVRGVMTAIAEGRLQLDGGSGDPRGTSTELRLAMEQRLARMIELRGIGPWTANYIAMRGLGWSDAFPEGDLVLRQALGNATTRACRERAEGWRPFRSYATVHLWANHTKG
jgi:AraC family transcriptional regulator of adaptative response / DNA-3-methyladenine glycosylase II